MDREVFYLLDPEFVVPSDASKLDATFWERMLGRAMDRTPKLGPATLEALVQLTLAPPPATAVAQHDFWRILTQYMSRGFVATTDSRSICETHLVQQYRPVLGDPENLQRLLKDSAATGRVAPLALVTPPEAWRSDSSNCAACQQSRIVRTSTTADLSDVEVARAWRTEFLSESSHTFVGLRGGATEMFPRIHFHPGAWNRLSSLEGDEAENVPKLVHHLGVLNDHALNIWRNHTEPVDRQAVLGGLNVTASPEGSNTRGSAKKMRERDFTFGGKIVRCEWHTKLRPNVNRVHFAVENDQLYVGTIVDHLTL